MENKNSFEILLHAGECPVGYQCMSNDCEECVKIHMEQGGKEMQP